MSDINILQSTQRIIVDMPSRTATVIQGGPVGPAGPAGSMSTATSALISGAAPRIILEETDQALDARKWRMMSDAGTFSIVSLNDAESAGQVTAFSVTRAGVIYLTGSGVTGIHMAKVLSNLLLQSDTPQLALNATGSNDPAMMHFQDGGMTRWSIYREGTTGDFILVRYNASATPIDNLLRFSATDGTIINLAKIATIITTTSPIKFASDVSTNRLLEFGTAAGVRQADLIDMVGSTFRLRKFNAAGNTVMAEITMDQSGNIVMTGVSVTVPTPTATNHAARKDYVDGLHNNQMGANLVRNGNFEDTDITVAWGTTNASITLTKASTQQTSGQYCAAISVNTNPAAALTTRYLIPVTPGESYEISARFKHDLAGATPGVHYLRVMQYKADGTASTPTYIDLVANVSNSTIPNWTKKEFTYTPASDVFKIRLEFYNYSNSTGMLFIDDVVVRQLHTRAAPISGPNQIAQVTAYNATTGQLGVGVHDVGDTGWRDISTLLDAGWRGTGSKVWIRRVNDTVSLYLTAVPTTVVADPPTTIIPSGITGFGYTGPVGSVGTADFIGYTEVGTAIPSSVIVRIGSSITVLTGNRIADNAIFVRCQATWMTLEAWPTTLPGVAA